MQANGRTGKCLFGYRNDDFYVIRGDKKVRICNRHRHHEAHPCGVRFFVGGDRSKECKVMQVHALSLLFGVAKEREI